MFLKVILTFIKKEFRQILRTRELLVILFVMPILQVIILGYAVTNEVKHVKLAIEDRDKSILSRRLIQCFLATDRFAFVPNKDNLSALELINDWQAQIVIIIPKYFGRDIHTTSKPTIQIITDGIDGNTATIAISFASGIITRFLYSEIIPDLLNTHLTMLLTKLDYFVLEIEDRLWYNENLNTAQYMVPGIVVILITVTSMMLSAMSLVKEKEIGTLEQIMVTPVKKSELLLGKLIPYWIISFFEILVVSSTAVVIFHIHFSGSIWNLIFMAAIYLLTTLGLGILVSTLTSTQQQAMFFSWFIMVFMLLLSGFFVPLRNMPEIIKTLTLVNPMRYMMTITREIVIKGSGLAHLWKEGSVLLCYGIFVFSFSVIKFRKIIK